MNTPMRRENDFVDNSSVKIPKSILIALVIGSFSLVSSGGIFIGLQTAEIKENARLVTQLKSDVFDGKRLADQDLRSLRDKTDLELKTLRDKIDFELKSSRERNDTLLQSSRDKLDSVDSRLTRIEAQLAYVSTQVGPPAPSTGVRR